MSNRQIFDVSGYCPTQGDEYLIWINYTEVPVLGKQHPSYRKGSFTCEYADDSGCTITEKCPVYMSAPIIRDS